MYLLFIPFSHDWNKNIASFLHKFIDSCRNKLGGILEGESDKLVPIPRIYMGMFSHRHLWNICASRSSLLATLLMFVLFVVVSRRAETGLKGFCFGPLVRRDLPASRADTAAVARGAPHLLQAAAAE